MVVPIHGAYLRVKYGVRAYPLKLNNDYNQIFALHTLS
jgi:hypothetical protein